MESAVDLILALLERAAHADYVGERVSQLDHALQAAHLAERARAPEHEVLAALLHDIGHVCAAEGSASMGGHGIAHHEDVGADYLAGLGLGPDVTELVRRHVAAKRYLVSARPEYRDRLSDASRITLEHQGGAMTPAECAAFAAAPAFEGVLRVRAWDEAAKEVGADVPGLEHYRECLERGLRG